MEYSNTKTQKCLMMLASAVVLACGTGFVSANNSLSVEQRDWINATTSEVSSVLESMEETIAGMDVFANPHFEESFNEAEEIHNADPLRQRLQAAQRAHEVYADHSILIFVSESLEHTGLMDAMEAASHDPRVMLVFRGIPDGMKLDEGVFHYQTMASEFDPMPNISLDPTLFEYYGVDVVPTIVKLEPVAQSEQSLLPSFDEIMSEDYDPILMTEMEPEQNMRAALASVRGLTDPAWLERELRSGRRGDLGQQGPIEEIGERDLIELMQERAMNIDWEQQKQGAQDRFWHNQGSQLTWLPPATRNRTYDLDPHVLVVEDIKDADGNILTEAGTLINPMDIVPFRLGLVIFDATDPLQVAVALEERERLLAREEVRETILMTSQLDTSNGWEHYTEVSNLFDQAIFSLTPDVKERFHIERVPTIIEPGDNVFTISEIATLRGDTPGENDGS